MKKLFKKSKSLFSLVLALVVLAVSLFTGVVYADAGETTACGERKTIGWDGTQATGIATGTGTKEDPYIIKTAEELAWLVTQKIDVTAGKYYEVDDTIGAIVLQSADKADDIIALKDSSAVKTYFESGSFTKWKTTGWEGSGFGGCFDGNGVTIYGLYTKGDRTNAALFSTVEGGCTIRNVAIKNSYISANMTVGSSDLQVGSLFATSLAGGNAPRKDGVVWVDGCIVANNYMYINRITKNQYIRAGVIGTVSEVVVVEDTLVYGNNATYDDGKKMPLIGTSNGFLFAKSSYQEGLVAKHVTDSGQTYVSNSFRNVLSLGSDLVNVNIKALKRANDPVCFENCYTDGAAGTVQFTDNSWTYTEGQIKKVAADNLSAVKLGDAFYTTGEMPELKAFHDETFTTVDNGDNTFTHKCSCGFEFTESSACGDRETIYWDGTQATGIATGKGTKEDPYIIKTAEELAWLVTQKIDVTAGKYYKVDDTIGAIVLQSADKADDIIALKDSSAVKTYFESGSFTKWKTTGWEGSGFGGCFDGNGVTIYGLYTKGDRTNAALFSTVEGGCTIRNVAIKNSYISANMTVGSSDLQVGSLFATSLAGGNAPRKDGVVWVDGCTVANNYMYINRITKNQYIRAGVIGTVSEVVVVEDTLVYGNNATYDDGKKMPLIGTSNGFLFAKSSYQEGLVAKHVTDSGQTYVSNSFRNVLSLGSDLVNVNIKAQKRANDPVCFENCYTDGAAGTVQFTDNSWTYTEGQIKKVAADNLSAVKLGDAFYTTSTMPELKVFHDVEFKLVDNGDGTHAYKCSCDFALASEEHRMVDGEVKIEGNCTTDRVVAQVCSICGSKGTDKVTTAPGHTEGEVKIENKVVEDCEKDGSYEEVVYCTVCEKELSRVKKTVGKLGHTEGEVKIENKVAADCENDGSYEEVVYCTVCEKELSRVKKTVGKLGHSEGEVKIENKVVEDCEKDGSYEEVVYCTVCEKELSRVKKTVGKLGHTEGEVKIENKVAADCENDGSYEEVVYCTVCEKELSRVKKTVGKLGHTEGEVKIENKVAADCENDGSYEEVVNCTVCKKELSRVKKTVGKLGHTEGEVKIENKVAADCVTDGSHDEVVYCTVCQKEVSREKKIDGKLGHTFKGVEAIEANCTTGGNIAHKVCEVCEKYFAADDTDVYSVEYLDYDKDIATDVDATDHDLVKYGKVEPTYENEGVEEHYACSRCEKIYADVEGKEEVETKDLIIDKLVKEEDNVSTEDKTEDESDDKTDDKPAGDNSNESPVTGESVVSVAAVAALIGAAFVFVRKSKKV